MTLSTRLILHSFLEQTAPEEKEELLGYLNLASRQAIVSCPKTYGSPLKSKEEPSKLLDWVHSSWISPFLRTLSEREVGLFLACLSRDKANAVGKELLYTGGAHEETQKPSLSPLGKTFLQTTLAHYLVAEADDLLPVECLPESPLNAFLSFPPETIPEFLDLFGLHDLAAEIKQVIDRQKLSKIHDSLTPNQSAYLKVLLQSHEPVVFTSMNLASWSGDQDKLKLLIQQRGANRLAKAIHGQDSSLIWYILHRFDMDKALLIRKLSTSVESPRASQLLIQQTVELIHYMSKETNG